MFKLLVLSVIVKLVSSGGESYVPSSVIQMTVRRLEHDSSTSQSTANSEVVFGETFNSVTSTEPGAADPSNEVPKINIKKRRRLVFKNP